jgi:hypothetical protein
MPDVLRVAAQEPFSAHALIYALLLDPRTDLRDLQLTRLKAAAEPQDFADGSNGRRRAHLLFLSASVGLRFRRGASKQ